LNFCDLFAHVEITFPDLIFTDLDIYGLGHLQIWALRIWDFWICPGITREDFTYSVVGGLRHMSQIQGSSNGIVQVSETPVRVGLSGVDLEESFLCAGFSNNSGFWGQCPFARNYRV